MFTPSFDLDALADLQHARVYGTADEYQAAIDALYASCTAAPVLCDTAYQREMDAARLDMLRAERKAQYLARAAAIRARLQADADRMHIAVWHQGRVVAYRAHMFDAHTAQQALAMVQR